MLRRTSVDDGGGERSYSYPFELPLGMDALEAEDYLSRHQPIHGRRMNLDPPIGASTLDLDPADGELVRMIREEWDWVLMPRHVLRVEPWLGSRVGRWGDPETEVTPEQHPDPAGYPRPYRAEDYVPLPAVNIPRAPSDGGRIPITDRQSSSRPTTTSGRKAGIVVWVQTYALRPLRGSGAPRKGHDRFHHLHFQVADPAVQDAHGLAALLEAGLDVPGWRVCLSPFSMSKATGDPVTITGRRDHVLRRDEVRAIRYVEHELVLDDMETAS